ncbi:MAG: outer membrane lipoprotein-sorting protein [Puniceicoccales bacterium]|jgi:hypothetical protein|nr:outer membrane lipoprotein-sorting protein [Puniceicoccales bacterium]
MKLSQWTFCFWFLLVQSLWQDCALYGYGGEFHKLHNLSTKKAEEFSKNVRKNFKHGNLNLMVKIKLYEPLKSNNKKFGEIFYVNSSKKRTFRVVFEDKEYDFTFSQDQAIKNSADDIFHTNASFFDDLLLTPQDLFLSFSWDDSYEYFGAAKVAGRPVQQFIRYEKNSINGIQYSSVKVSIDAKYMIILRIDFLNDVLMPVRQLLIRSFKDFAGIWMPKIIEIIDFQHHRHAKLEVLSVETKI